VTIGPISHTKFKWSTQVEPATQRGGELKQRRVLLL